MKILRVFAVVVMPPMITLLIIRLEGNRCSYNAENEKLLPENVAEYQ